MSLTIGADGAVEHRALSGALEPTVRARGRRAPLELSDGDAVRRARTRCLATRCGRRMIADVPLGAFLSGGIDSSTVVALMQARAMPPVRTFSIGFTETGLRRGAARRARSPRHLGTEHTELYVEPDARRASVIPQLPACYDEPFADSSQIPTYLVSKLTREHVTVALSGDGGDELFAGYTRYRFARVSGNVPAPRRAGLGTRLGRRGPRTSGTGLFRASSRTQAPGHGRRQDAQGWRVLLSTGGRRRAIAAWSRLGCRGDRAPDAVEPKGPIFDCRHRARAARSRSTRMQYLDPLTYLPDDILTKVDRASMAVALEVRVPILDHRVVEFSWRLPLTLQDAPWQGKWLLRQVLYRHVPQASGRTAEGGLRRAASAAGSGARCGIGPRSSCPTSALAKGGCSTQS